jgi:nicotinate phosphoribosyltransferase
MGIYVYMENSELAPWFERKNLALLTDLYELTMMAGYYKEGRGQIPVTFDYFFRSLPLHSGFAIFAGLDSLLQYLKIYILLRATLTIWKV